MTRFSCELCTLIDLLQEIRRQTQSLARTFSRGISERRATLTSTSSEGATLVIEAEGGASAEGRRKLSRSASAPASSPSSTENRPPNYTAREPIESIEVNPVAANETIVSGGDQTLMM